MAGPAYYLFSYSDVPLSRLCKNDDQPIEEYLLSPCDLLALISKTYVENGTSQEGSVIYF